MVSEVSAKAWLVIKSERAKKVASKSSLQVSGKELNLIIKADVSGSLEAIAEAIAKLKNAEVKINILDQSAGEISENDVLRAQAASASIIGFHTRLSPQAAKLASARLVPVRLYSVIYELVEELTRSVVEMLTPEVLRTDLGRAKVLAVFRSEKDWIVIGDNVGGGKLKDSVKLEI